jgi:hypothetical protein
MANRTGQRNQANGRYGSPYDYSARLADKLYETYGGKKKMYYDSNHYFN